MNEKIRELALQAGAGQHEGYEVLYHTFSPTALEKFAELIVQECAQIARGNEDDTTARQIESRFGVEE